jgi:flagellin-like hook-associated protein FlgL
MAQDIAAAMDTLGGGNAASVAAQTLAIAGSTAAGTSPFSAFLDDPAGGGAEARRATPSGDGEVIGYGIAANRNASAASTGVSTGGWARDLLRNLMSVAALTPAQRAAPEDVDAMVSSIRQGFESAERALGEEAGALGAVESRIESAQRRHSLVSGVLARQLGDIQEVDLAETLTRLQATRTALEASYRALGSISQLTLAQFLR